MTREPRRLSDPSDRFAARVSAPDSNGCTEWAGGKIRSGYGKFWFEGSTVTAHRFALEQHTGRPIPAGLVVDHLCRNVACVNPKHLEAVTQQINIARGRLSETNTERAAARTHCRAGHEFHPGSTRIRSDGKRECIQCRRATDREAARRRRQRLALKAAGPVSI